MAFSRRRPSCGTSRAPRRAPCCLRAAGPPNVVRHAARRMRECPRAVPLRVQQRLGLLRDTGPREAFWEVPRKLFTFLLLPERGIETTQAVRRLNGPLERSGFGSGHPSNDHQDVRIEQKGFHAGIEGYALGTTQGGEIKAGRQTQKSRRRKYLTTDCCRPPGPVCPGNRNPRTNSWK